VSVEKELFDYLRAHAPLTAKIGADKVFFGRAPDGEAFDYVVISKIAGNRLTKVGFGSPLFQVSYFSRSEFRAADGADILVAALDGYKGTWGTMQVVGNYQDDRILVEDGAVFHAPVGIRINFLEV
jgi:hypothetical protein